MHQHDIHTNDGAGHPSPVALESVRITLELYRSGKAGIDFVKLQQFSKPILTHYQIDLPVGFLDKVTPGNLEDMVLLLDVLETATIFWDYCSLSPSAKPAAFKQLQENLLGPHPDQEDLVQFPILIAAMEEIWEELSDGKPMTRIAETEPVAPPNAEEPFFSSDSIHNYGPEQLEIPDAFALFARPLLENEAIYEDPESLDDVMSKAQAYWDLAHLSGSEIHKNLKAIASKFGTHGCPAEQVEREALKMIERFHELFPERK